MSSTEPATAHPPGRGSPGRGVARITYRQGDRAEPAAVGNDEEVDSIVIRPVRAAELPAVAELRWHMHHARRQTTAPFDDYVAGFVAWALEHESSHRCLVAVSGETVIGMAWLAVTPRVPTPGKLRRVVGDVQSVFVLPEHRNHGVGGRLVEAVLALARDLDLERVTVHSGRQAVPVYERAGFARSPVLLRTDTTARQA